MAEAEKTQNDIFTDIKDAEGVDTGEQKPSIDTPEDDARLSNARELANAKAGDYNTSGPSTTNTAEPTEGADNDNEVVQAPPTGSMPYVEAVAIDGKISYFFTPPPQALSLGGWEPRIHLGDSDSAGHGLDGIAAQANSMAERVKADLDRADLQKLGEDAVAADRAGPAGDSEVYDSVPDAVMMDMTEQATTDEYMNRYDRISHDILTEQTHVDADSGGDVPDPLEAFHHTAQPVDEDHEDLLALAAAQAHSEPVRQPGALPAQTPQMPRAGADLADVPEQPRLEP